MDKVSDLMMGAYSLIMVGVLIAFIIMIVIPNIVYIIAGVFIIGVLLRSL